MNTRLVRVLGLFRSERKEILLVITSITLVWGIGRFSGSPTSLFLAAFWMMILTLMLLYSLTVLVVRELRT